MSFSIDWLDLREPADHAARNPELIKTLAQWCAGRAPRILDLGSGTGSSYRGLAPMIGGHWTLTDIDPALLQEATRRHQAEPTFAATRVVDLNADLESLITEVQPDVICGSALIDLASAAWLDRLAAALPQNAAFYMALSYNGFEQWLPAPTDEAAAHAAFLSHQRTDKGFGQALGPDAANYMADALTKTGRQPALRDSPWTLGETDRPLIAALADGSAEAVAETSALSDAKFESWAAGRRAVQTVEVGHLDLLALPAT